MTLQRLYLRCSACGHLWHPADQRLGLEEYLSPRARRMITYLAGRHPFADSRQTLTELLGWTVASETIRQATEREAGRLQRWRAQTDQVDAAFEQASGNIELEIDATKVNTRESGWRDLKLAVVSKRLPGKPATTEQWDDRKLPHPAGRVAWAAVEEIGSFTQRSRDWLERLLDSPNALVYLLGDGAEWIWNLAAEVCPQRRELLDVFHAFEHLAAAVKAIFADQEAVNAWLQRGRLALLGDGWPGLNAWIAEVLQHRDDAEARAAVDALTTYFSKHTGRLQYYHRLHQGLPIGSGLIEGACKSIARRFKLSKARWQLANVQVMGELGVCQSFGRAVAGFVWKWDNRSLVRASGSKEAGRESADFGNVGGTGAGRQV